MGDVIVVGGAKNKADVAYVDGQIAAERLARANAVRDTVERLTADLQAKVDALTANLATERGARATAVSLLARRVSLLEGVLGQDALNAIDAGQSSSTGWTRQHPPVAAPTFDLPFSLTPFEKLELSIDGVPQLEGVDFTAAGSVVTLLNAPGFDPAQSVAFRKTFVDPA